MKKIILGSVMGIAVAVGAQAFAFVPAMNNYSNFVDGHQTLNAQDASGNPVVVIGGQSYQITDDNKVSQAWAIQAKVFELQKEIAGLPKEDCAAK